MKIQFLNPQFHMERRWITSTRLFLIEGLPFEKVENTLIYLDDISGLIGDRRKKKNTSQNLGSADSITFDSKKSIAFDSTSEIGYKDSRIRFNENIKDTAISYGSSTINIGKTLDSLLDPKSYIFIPSCFLVSNRSLDFIFLVSACSENRRVSDLTGRLERYSQKFSQNSHSNHEKIRISTRRGVVKMTKHEIVEFLGGQNYIYSHDVVETVTVCDLCKLVKKTELITVPENFEDFQSDLKKNNLPILIHSQMKYLRKNLSKTFMNFSEDKILDLKNKNDLLSKSIISEEIEKILESEFNKNC